MARRNKNEQLIAELEQQRQVIDAQIAVLKRANSWSAPKSKPRKSPSSGTGNTTLATDAKL